MLPGGPDMKTMTRPCAALVLALVVLVALLPASAAFAKSPTDKIGVSGPGLVGPVEIADPASLSGFNPWTRGFIAWDRGGAAGRADLHGHLLPQQG